MAEDKEKKKPRFANVDEMSKYYDDKIDGLRSELTEALKGKANAKSDVSEVDEFFNQDTTKEKEGDKKDE